MKHLLGACEDHASHLDIRDLVIVGTVVLSINLLIKLKEKNEIRKSKQR